MDVVFYTSPKAHRIEIAENFAAGVRAQGDQIKFRPLGTGFESRCNAAVIIGNKTRYMLEPLQVAGVPIVCLDRAYPILNPDGELARDRAYARATVNGSHPVHELLSLDQPDDRRKLFNWNPKSWRENRAGAPVLFAGSALSYYMRIGVTDIREHTEGMLAAIRVKTRREVLFRPKPNARAAFGEEGPHTAISSVLAPCHAVVIEESSVALEALLMGIPAVILGPSPTRLISSANLNDIEDPHLASDEAKISLLNNLAYYQYDQTEYRDGTAWSFLRKRLS